jgi:hypothetical protein
MQMRQYGSHIYKKVADGGKLLRYPVARLWQGSELLRYPATRLQQGSEPFLYRVSVNRLITKFKS